MKARFFYGWIIAIACGLGIACSFSVLIPATLGLLVRPLGADFHWSIQQVMAASAFATGAGVLVGPFVGAVIDRIGARKIIFVSMLLEALIIFSFVRMSDSLPLFYSRYAALSLLCSGCTAIGFTTIISKWFHQRRGLALGIALAGTGLGGMIWSLTVSALFASIGWRASFAWFAAFIGLVAAPALFLVLRDEPAAMGLYVDGDADEAASSLNRTSGMTLGEAARTRQFWLLMGVAFLVAFGVQSIMFNLVPIVRANGDEHNVAGTVQASLWAALVIGRVMTGWLLDRFQAPLVAVGFLILPIAGAAMFSFGASGNHAFVAAMLVGLAAGAEVDTFAYMASRYFGLKQYSRIYGACFSLFGLGAGVGPVVTAHIAQGSSGYPVALRVLIAALALAAVILLFFRRLPAQQPKSAKGRQRDLLAGSVHS